MQIKTYSYVNGCALGLAFIEASVNSKMGYFSLFLSLHLDSHRWVLPHPMSNKMSKGDTPFSIV